MTDPDIGRCDDCGSEDGILQQTLRPVMVDGRPEVAAAWLCESCRKSALAGLASAWLEPGRSPGYYE